MAETQYGLIEAKKPEFPPINLLGVPHRGGVLTVAYPAFGPATYNKNVAEMQKPYSHPETGAKIIFREPTTSESISAAAYNFGSREKVDTKRDIFNPKWLQAGKIVRTLEGVFVNPPKDETRDFVTNESVLRLFLNSAKPIKVGKGIIYIVPDIENLKDFGYAEYETFKQGVQESREFAESGLARVLEHIEEPAKNLGEISSAKFYPLGVNVWGFDNVKEPVLRVAVLYSDRGSGIGWLDVYGYVWDDGDYGCAFGVLD